MSSDEHPVSRNVYVAVLNKDDPSPLAPESDEEKPARRPREPRAASDGKKAEEGKDSAKARKPRRARRPTNR